MFIKNLPAIFLFAFLCASLQMGIGGYEFGSSNQSLQIPYLNALIHPELYPHDPFMNAMVATYGSIYYPLLALIFRFSGASIFGVFFFLQTLFLTLSFVALWRLSWAILRNEKFSYFAMFALLLPKPVLADGVVFDVIHTHESAVFPFLVLALAFAIVEKFFRGVERWHDSVPCE